MTAEWLSETRGSLNLAILFKFNSLGKPPVLVVVADGVCLEWFAFFGGGGGGGGSGFGAILR